MNLPFEGRAADELDAVVRFYETERAGYGRLFLAEVSKKVSRAAEFPKSGGRVMGTQPEHDVRAFVLSKFPYSVVTALVAGRRVVIAVAHHHRGPQHWQARFG